MPKRRHPPLRIRAGLLTVLALAVATFAAVPATASATPLISPPMAAFTVTTQNPVLGLPVSFDASDSYQPSGSITQYDWNFGDGTSTISPSSPTASHTYEAAGTYTVTLTVTGSAGGLTGTATQTVTIPSTVTGPVPGQPKAHITVSTPHPVAGWPVPLSAVRSTDRGWDLISWTWSFGDGTIGLGQTLSHRFSKPGTYPVTLTVADGSNASATTTEMVKVGSASITSVSVRKGSRVERLGLQISGPGRLTVGSKRASIRHPETYTLSVKLVRAQRNRLRHHHSVNVSVRLKFVPSVGITSRRTVRFTVKP